MEILDFELGALVNETVQSQSWALRNKSLPVTVHGLDQLAHHFRGDPGRVRQVLTNLISNAIKFTAQGSIRIEVSVTAPTAGRSLVRFAVTDTGIGIAPQAKARLFQPFTQADESTTRKFGGTGLGLSISQRLVQLMGGTMDVDSVEGQGSTFWFTVDLGDSATSVTAPVVTPGDSGDRVRRRVDPDRRGQRDQPEDLARDAQEDGLPRAGRGERDGGLVAPPRETLRPDPHGLSNARDGRLRDHPPDPRERLAAESSSCPSSP